MGKTRDLRHYAEVMLMKKIYWVDISITTKSGKHRRKT